MNNTIKKIIKFLEQNGTHLNSKDGPYEMFDAELQDWGFNAPGQKILFAGYFFEQNGDLVPDPNITLWLLGDDVTDVQVQTSVGTFHKDMGFALEFLELVWERHFFPRMEAEVD